MPTMQRELDRKEVKGVNQPLAENSSSKRPAINDRIEYRYPGIKDNFKRWTADKDGIEYPAMKGTHI
ncbi:hypothetical protein SBOR_9667 [Sclerotinia borealis F-4128]|uniref:Uncharacterized protein n=1 Tax=Sclerotinia borealis (strain F-4128) TaxID=1432307 RepID=W9C2P0_SCLBF|nr:hypothetical protein SBOR_9667 [Sclerotinia borealis F-4128]